MRVWRLLVRITALVTLVLCYLGFVLLGSMLRREMSHPISPLNAPHFHTVFVIMNTIDVCFLVAMIATSLALLLVLRSSAVRIYTFLYVAIFIYSLGLGALWSNGPWGSSIAAASGVGDMGLAPLVLYPVPFAYGILSMLLVNIAGRKSKPLIVAA